MINLTPLYITSQVLVIIAYILITITYFLKHRKQILGVNIAAHISQALSYACLNGFTGFAMNLIYIFRDSFFVIDEKNRSSTKITKRDIYILIILLLIIGILTVFTFDGWKSLLSVVATTISTIAIWQKKPEVYKALGIPVSILWLTYNIFLKSVFGVILESILLISIISSYIKERINS